MKHIHDINDIERLHWAGKYSASDITYAHIADVLHSKRIMWDALHGPAMLTSKAADTVIEKTIRQIDDIANPFIPRAYPRRLRKQGSSWLFAHGTTLTALKQDYNNAAYTSRVMLGKRVITYYNVPEILADIIVRTGNYEQRDLMEA